MAQQPGDRAREIRERIRGNFDRAASAYAGFEAERTFFRALVGALLEGAPALEGKRVLDVGCGTGASLEVLAERVGPQGSAVGLDVSLGMLREASRRLGARAPVVLLDGCRFGSAFRRTFDAVVYNAVIFMLPDARGSLESARALLSNTGTVFLSSLEGASVLPDREPLPDFLRRRGLAPGRHALSPWPAVAEILGELFGEVDVRRFAVPMNGRDFAAFYGMEPMSAGLLPNLAYPERRRIVQELALDWGDEVPAVEQVWTLAAARTSHA